MTFKAYVTVTVTVSLTYVHFTFTRFDIGLNTYQETWEITQGGAKKRGHHLIANILKFHDRIAWKLVNFCNIIC